tara:strand:+ start:165 stop:689 length:525 start_codon:yes stop_codon:yes gene_type:complete
MISNLIKLLIAFTLMLFCYSGLSAGNDTALKIGKLEKRLSTLERENTKLTERVLELEKGQTNAKAIDLPTYLPQNENEKKKFLEVFRRELKSNRDLSSGPWTKPEGWKTIRKRMSEFSVREALGQPTRIRPSIKPSIEIVYFYIGDLNSDGIDEEGYVNFKDKRVVSFKSPHAK